MLERLTSLVVDTVQALNNDSVMRNSSICQRICELPNLLLGYRNAGQGNLNLQPLRVGNSDSGPTPLEKLQKEELQHLYKLYYTDAKANSKKQNKTGEPKDPGSSNYEEAGRECEICNTNAKTHYAVPCGHASCLTCWSRWLMKNPNCMICQTKVAKIQRYSYAIVPRQLNEAEPGKSVKSERGLSLLLLDVEDAQERVIRSLLDIKNAFADIVDSLETVEGHLYALTRPESGTTVDALASVLAVECVSVTEVLNKYKDIFNSRSSSEGVIWKALEAETAKLIRSVAALDEWIKKRKNDGISEEDTSEDKELNHAIMVLETMGMPTSIIGQWKYVKQLVHKLSNNHHLLPGILGVFGLIQATSTNIIDAGASNLSESANRIMQLAEKATKKYDEKINSLVNTLVPDVIKDVVALKSSKTKMVLS